MSLAKFAHDSSSQARYSTDINIRNRTLLANNISVCYVCGVALSFKSIHQACWRIFLTIDISYTLDGASHTVGR